MSRDASTSKMKNYNSIDLAKFVCSLLVIIIHCVSFNADEMGRYIWYDWWAKNYLPRLAVPFFFTATGFFLYKKSTLETFNIKPIKQWVIKMLKLYGILTVIYLPLKIWDLHKESEDFLYIASNYLRYLIFNGSFYHLWFLPAAIASVALISALLYRRVPLKRILAFAFITYFIGVFAQSWCGLIIQPLRGTVFETPLQFAGKYISFYFHSIYSGFLYTGLGMLFAFGKISIPKKAARNGFIISMIALFIEMLILWKLDPTMDTDVYLSLVPAIFLGFSYLLQTDLPDHKLFKMMRASSVLNYYLHFWVLRLMIKVLYLLGFGNHIRWPILFVLTTLTTLACSAVLLKLSAYDKHVLYKYHQ